MKSTLGFFVHIVSVGGLYVSLAHYTFRWLQNRKRKVATVIVTPSN